MFKLQDKLKWNYNDIVNFILENDLENNDIYAIKIIKNIRTSIINIGEDKFIERIDRI